MVELYITPLADGKIVKQKYYTALFPDISTILGLNMNLLTSLKRKFEDWDNDKSVIGDEFVKFAPYFKMYQKLSCFAFFLCVCLWNMLDNWHFLWWIFFVVVAM